MQDNKIMHNTGFNNHTIKMCMTVSEEDFGRNEKAL